MSTAAGPMIGRDNELEQLDRLLGEARGGSFRFVSVSGEPGIGKTSLLSALAQRADAQGCLVVEGRATELEREIPYGPIVDALDAYLASLDPHSHDRLAADGLQELGAVFPAFGTLERRSVQPAATAAERFRAHRDVRDLLERLAARQPMLLALDDLHWVDGASLELIRHLIRRPPDAAILVLATFRPAGAAGPAMTAATDAGARDGRVVAIRLGALAPHDADRLVDGIGAAQRAHLLRESGGNPFYLLQLARSSTTARPRSSAAPGDDGVPAAVQAAIADELAELASPARAFAQAASVTGDPFDLDVAIAVAAVAEPTALDALDELIARDVIRPGAVPRTFRFRHPLVRSAIYASASAGVRLVAHERAGAALALRGAPAATRAHHVEQSARHGDTAALAVLREAGLATAQRAPSSAARWFEAALRVMPESAAAGERSELLLALAGTQAATGRLEDSRAALLRSIELTASDGSPPPVALISACAGIEELLGRHRDAHARLAGALEGLEDPNSTQGAALMIDLAVDAFFRMEYERLREWATRALTTARPLGDRPLTAATAAIAAFGGALTGAIGEARSCVAESVAIVEVLSDAELATRLDATAWLTSAEFYLDRFADGIGHAERGLAIARATGQGALIPGLAQALGNCLFHAGRLREAEEVLDEAVESARLSDTGVALAWGLLNRAYAALLAGDADLCLRCAAEAVRLTSEMHSSVVAAWSGVIYGYALLEADEPARAVEALVAAAGGEDAPFIPGGWQANWHEAMTRCLLALDRPDDAAQAADRADARARAFDLPVARALADRALAAVALDARDAARAAELALASAAGADRAGAPLEGAFSRTLAGRALADAGDVELAVQELEHAAATLDACGAPRHRDKAERELRRLGKAVHRRTRRGRSDAGGVASLTGRELEIARLVVGRRTNPQIAGELFLSIKTVETHMRNIFRKLDASSRVEVARIIERAQPG